MSIDKTVKHSRPLLLLTALVVLFIGLGLVWLWWPDFISLFKGIVSLFTVLTGLVFLYMVKE